MIRTESRMFEEPSTCGGFMQWEARGSLDDGRPAGVYWPSIISQPRATCVSRHTLTPLTMHSPAPLALVCLVACLTPAHSAGLTWSRDSASVALLSDAQIVWRFQHGTNATKPLFHPVALPGQPSLTWDQPGDHRWHRALWFSWKFINGVNYWEEDPRTGAANGRTEWSAPRIETRPDYGARIALDITYRPAGGAAVLTETRVIVVSPPAPDGSWQMDWDMTFTVPHGQVRLDRTPLPTEPDGKPYGGYAGLSVRLAQDLRDIRATTSEGPVSFSGGRFRGKAPAFDYAGTLNGRTAGIAIVSHPANVNSPSPWYAIQDGPMLYFSPAVLCYGALELKKDETLRLRYRVLVHPGAWDSDRLRLETARLEP